MHSLRPQLELELSGDRAAALLEELKAKDAGRPPAMMQAADEIEVIHQLSSYIGAYSKKQLTVF